MSTETQQPIALDMSPIGFVTPANGAVRFHMSDRAFAALDGAIFSSAHQAAVAARAHRERLLGLRPFNRPAPRAA